MNQKYIVWHRLDGQSDEKQSILYAERECQKYEVENKTMVMRRNFIYLTDIL